jgi:cyclic dehypoxanthinyl futalosine synthase
MRDKSENLLFERALRLEPLSAYEGLTLFNDASTPELIWVADALRQIHKPGRVVTWMIDRNVNITNICFSQCSFCNFCRKKGSEDAYVTTIGEYSVKIDELISLGGNQLLLQGGMNPALGLDFYIDLFNNLKKLYPLIKLHALGPPEIVFLANKESISYRDVLVQLINAGLDSLPGAGGEILSDRVRKIISPAKATSEEWMEVMYEAHKLNLPTSATMMYGHIESNEERIDHLIKIRELQARKPENHFGFITFIPWPFQDTGTVLLNKYGIKSRYNGPDYLKIIAISRIMLNNIKHIQASILTVGKEIGMLSLHSGANDLGSIMIEENVVSAAGSNNRFNADMLQSIIKDAGYTPGRRNQKYEFL